MTVRFLADEDLDSDIVSALLLREPSIDILDVKTAGLRGTPDRQLLENAAAWSRIVVSHDRRTMTFHFRERLEAGLPTSGLFIVPQRASIRDVVDSLLLVAFASDAEEWNGRVVWLPIR